MPGPWTLRTYRTGDFEAVLAVFHDAIHGLAGDAYGPQQLEAWAPAMPDREDWARRLAHRHVAVAVDEEDRVGAFIAWTDEGTIDLLYVAPRASGQGVATRLYGQAESALRRIGVDLIRTDASDVARPFFLRQGFRAVRENRVVRLGVELRNTTMEKVLSGPPA